MQPGASALGPLSQDGMSSIQSDATNGAAVAAAAVLPTAGSTDEWSVFVVFRHTTDSGQVLWSQYINNSSNVSIRLIDGGDGVLDMMAGTTTFLVGSTNTGDGLIHTAGVAKGEGSSRFFRLYIDGIEEANSPSSTHGSAIADTAFKLGIHASTPWKGIIGPALVKSTADWSAAQFLRLHQLAIGKRRNRKLQR